MSGPQWGEAERALAQGDPADPGVDSGDLLVTVAISDGGVVAEVSRASVAWPDGTAEATVRAWINHAADGVRSEMFDAAGLDPSPMRPTLASAIVAAVLAGIPGALGWPDVDPGSAYVIVTDTGGWHRVDTRPGGTAETVTQFAQRVEFGAVRHAAAALASAKADALRAEGRVSAAIVLDDFAADQRAGDQS